MWRVEWMSDHAALRVRTAARLDLAHRETGRARRNDHLGRQQLIELAVQLLLKLDPLWAIFLDEVRALDRCREIGREGEFRLGRASGQAQSLERRPRRFDELLQGGLRIRRDVGR